MRSPHSILCTALLLGFLSSGRASPAFDAARGLFDQHHFREAETALRAVVKAEPANAAACHYLARTIIARLPIEEPKKEEAEARAKDAAQFLARAAELEPKNAAYLRDFGMSQITGLTSLKKGRKTVEEALALNPRDPETHAFLAVMYSAPWMLGGDKDKAEEHRRAVQALDPAGFAIDEVNRQIWVEKNFPAAFSLCESLLQKDPDNALGHYLYGYVAAESKTNLDRGMASLKRALELPRLVSANTSAYSQPFAATPSSCWEQMGKIERDRNRPDAARAAFTTAVELDPGNYWAARALAKLKS
jgi:tetratricopeptide (TPR) repeat protein